MFTDALQFVVFVMLMFRGEDSSLRDHPEMTGAESQVNSSVMATAMVRTASEALGGSSTQTATEMAPLSGGRQEIFVSGAEDTLPATELHYVKSNEVRHDVWFPYIKGRTGAYLGVGSDQNYTLIGFSDVELVFLMDIDERVVNLHRVYSVFIKESESPEALLERWSPESKEASSQLLREAFADLPVARRKAIVSGYRSARETVYRHLRLVHGRKRDVGTTWLSNPRAYQRVRSLYLAGRVRMMLGDVTGAVSMASVVDILRRLEVPVGVVYLSNAEEFIPYNPNFVTHMSGLLSHDDSVLLRTLSGKGWDHADRMWNYQVQPLRDLKRRLAADKRPRSSKAMIRTADKDGVIYRAETPSGLSTVGCGSDGCR
ncbi:MAG: hypothetical protein ACPHRO_00570 [Nannocystaceae bacterium]